MIENTETIHNFNKQCFIVTGGAQGLGGAITQRLAASNATVAIWDIDADASAQMKEPCASDQNFVVRLYPRPPDRFK